MTEEGRPSAIFPDPGPGAGARLAVLLQQLGQAPLTESQGAAFDTYLALLLRWNAKVNLTAIRDVEDILRRHFLESILCARLLPSGVATLLDYGSGGGFPGLPIAICRPEIAVTLAESQAKKSAFLMEAVRTLGVETRVFGGRVDAMPSALLYDMVTLRAVDRMREACEAARGRVRPGGWLAILATQASLTGLVEGLAEIAWRPPETLAGAEQEVLLLGRRLRG